MKSGKRYILNSAVLTAFGKFEYKEVNQAEAKWWFEDKGSEYPKSTIGYQETADVLSELLAAKIPLNRETIRMEVGDEALVFRLVLPPGTPRIASGDKGAIGRAILEHNFELGILKRFE